MNEKVYARIRSMFDVPHMQNSLRGLWVEAMVCEILGSGWKHTGNDWAAWDLERSDGLRVEVKQSARQQSWGTSTSLPRFSVAAAKGHYPNGKTYVDNALATRLADVYIFAWHEGEDQREASEWLFYVVEAKRLRDGQKTLGLRAINKLAEPVSSSVLRELMMQVLN
jgi:hypothetical protein